MSHTFHSPWLITQFFFVIRRESMKVHYMQLSHPYNFHSLSAKYTITLSQNEIEPSFVVFVVY